MWEITFWFYLTPGDKFLCTGLVGTEKVIYLKGFCILYFLVGFLIYKFLKITFSFANGIFFYIQVVYLVLRFHCYIELCGYASL